MLPENFFCKVLLKMQFLLHNIRNQYRLYQIVLQISKGVTHFSLPQIMLIFVSWYFSVVAYIFPHISLVPLEGVKAFNIKKFK